MTLIEDGGVIGLWGPRARKDGDDDQASDVTTGTAVDIGDPAAIGIGGGGPGRVWRARHGGGRRCRWERRSGRVELPPARGTGKAEVANLGEAAGEYVLEESREPRRRGQRAACHLAGTPITKPERDTAVVEGPGDCW